MSLWGAPMPSYNTPYPTFVKAEAGEGGYPPTEQPDTQLAPWESSLGTTYEITQPPPPDRLVERLSKWILQRTSRNMLAREQAGKRMQSCMRKLAPKKQFLEIHKNEKKAFYKGFMVCGCLWVCPVCAMSITEGRRRELQLAIREWESRGGSITMTTHTVRHNRGDSLEKILNGLGKARRLMMNRKPYQRIKKTFGVAGTVRALEVTFSENGWHVHDHEINFHLPGFTVSCSQYERDLLPEWISACVSSGLDTPDHHGVKIHDGTEAGKYASKWGMESELTKSHVKVGREGSMTPWDFLREGRKDLFLEYARCFRGKRQLVWSRGLKDLLGIREKTDQELAEHQDEISLLIARIEQEYVRYLVNSEQQGELLIVAEREGKEGVLRFLAELKTRFEYGDDVEYYGE